MGPGYVCQDWWVVMLRSNDKNMNVLARVLPLSCTAGFSFWSFKIFVLLEIQQVLFPSTKSPMQRTELVSSSPFANYLFDFQNVRFHGKPCCSLLGKIPSTLSTQSLKRFPKCKEVKCLNLVRWTCQTWGKPSQPLFDDLVPQACPSIQCWLILTIRLLWSLSVYYVMRPWKLSSPQARVSASSKGLPL